MTGPERKALQRELIAKLRKAESLGDTDAIRRVVEEYKTLDSPGVQVTPAVPWGGDLAAWQRQRGKAYTPPPPPAVDTSYMRTVQNIAHALEFARQHERNFSQEVHEAERLGVELPHVDVPAVPEMSEVMVRLRTEKPEAVELWVDDIARQYAARASGATDTLAPARRLEHQKKADRQRQATLACIERLKELGLTDTYLFDELRWSADDDEDDDD